MGTRVSCLRLHPKYIVERGRKGQRACQRLWGSLSRTPRQRHARVQSSHTILVPRRPYYLLRPHTQSTIWEPRRSVSHPSWSEPRTESPSAAVRLTHEALRMPGHPTPHFPQRCPKASCSSVPDAMAEPVPASPRLVPLGQRLPLKPGPHSAHPALAQKQFGAQCASFQGTTARSSISNMI